jgi:hypothetical protein
MNFVGVSAVSYIEPMPTLGFCMVEAHLANKGGKKRMTPNCTKKICSEFFGHKFLGFRV